MASKQSTILTTVKILTLILGVCTLGLGLWSHYESNWIKSVGFDLLEQRNKTHIMIAYKVCDLPESIGTNCPRIWMERYFVYAIIISFVFLLVAFVAGFVIDMKSAPLKWIDFACQIICAVFLLTAGIVYITSSLKMRDILGRMYMYTSRYRRVSPDFRGKEKIAAGSLAIIQSVLHGAVSILVGLL